MVPSSSVLALDVGAARIGVAVATLEARLPRPLTTLPNDDSVFDRLEAIIKDETIGILVVGLPRGLQGQTTGQTEDTTAFVEQLNSHFSLPVHLQDEALTSKQATAELEARGKDYKREDIDALAAVYILGDWLTENTVK